MTNLALRVSLLFPLAGAVLALTAGPCEKAASDCAGEPLGILTAFVESPGAPSVSRFTGTVTRMSPEDPDGFLRVVVRKDSGGDDSLKVAVPGNLLLLVVGRTYDFQVEHIGGRPPASALVVSDGDGLVFAGATDQAVGAHVLKDGLPGFEIQLTDAGCASRASATCYKAIVNRRLDVHGSGTGVSLWNGQSGALGGYRAVCLTAQRVEYSPDCADAGLPAVSWVITRSDSTEPGR